jgi:two-component system, OmpR family, response regulator
MTGAIHGSGSRHVNLRPRILAVDDDPTARLFIALTLSPLAVDVYVTATCREFRAMSDSMAADLYLIDIELPDGDGFLMAEALRARCATPMIFLSVHGDDGHRLRALELGAMEYLSKPIHPREFSLRIQNILTSLRGHGAGAAIAATASQPTPPLIRRFRGLTLDVSRRRLTDDGGRDMGLTAAEFEVLALLTGEPQRVVTRAQFAQRLGPQSAARYNTRIVDILVWRLRKKLQRVSGLGQFIATVPSRGYMFVEPLSPE